MRGIDNTFNESSLVAEVPAGAKNKSFESELARLRRLGVKKLTAPVRRSTVVDSRIKSVKILALTLLREIESLEQHSEKGTVADITLQDEVHHFEAELIRSALIRTGGRQRRAASLLNMKVTTLNRKIQRYGIVVVEDDLNHKNGLEGKRPVN